MSTRAKPKQTSFPVPDVLVVVSLLAREGVCGFAARRIGTNQTRLDSFCCIILVVTLRILCHYMVMLKESRVSPPGLFWTGDIIIVRWSLLLRVNCNEIYIL